jgi:hypothetical protein
MVSRIVLTVSRFLQELSVEMVGLLGLECNRILDIFLMFDLMESRIFQLASQDLM